MTMIELTRESGSIINGRPVHEHLRELLANRDHCAELAERLGFERDKALAERDDALAALQQARDADGAALDQLGIIARMLPPYDAAGTAVPEKVRRHIEQLRDRLTVAEAMAAELRERREAEDRVVDAAMRLVAGFGGMERMPAAVELQDAVEALPERGADRG